MNRYTKHIFKSIIAFLVITIVLPTLAYKFWNTENALAFIMGETVALGIIIWVENK